MSADILIVFTILGIAVVFLVTEWIPMEVTALLVLGALWSLYRIQFLLRQ